MSPPWPPGTSTSTRRPAAHGNNDRQHTHRRRPPSSRHYSHCPVNLTLLRPPHRYPGAGAGPARPAPPADPGMIPGPQVATLHRSDPRLAPRGRRRRTASRPGACGPRSRRQLLHDETAAARGGPARIQRDTIVLTRSGYEESRKRDLNKTPDAAGRFAKARYGGRRLTRPPAIPARSAGMGVRHASRRVLSRRSRRCPRPGASGGPARGDRRRDTPPGLGTDRGSSTTSRTVRACPARPGLDSAGEM